MRWKRAENRKSAEGCVTTSEALKCPECGSSKIYKDGLRYTNEERIQRYLCRVCGYRFSESTIKVNVAGKVAKGFNSREDNHEIRVASGNASEEEVNNGLSFASGEDVSSHDISIIEISLYGLPFYNSKHEVCARKSTKKCSV